MNLAPETLRLLSRVGTPLVLNGTELRAYDLAALREAGIRIEFKQGERWGRSRFNDEDCKDGVWSMTIYRLVAE